MHQINSQIYPFTLAIAIGLNDFEDAKKKLKGIENEVIEKCNDGVVYCDNIYSKKTKRNTILLYIESLKIPLLAHEATHVATRLFEYIHENKPSTEAYAYLVEWVCEEVVKYNDKLSTNVSTQN